MGRVFKPEYTVTLKDGTVDHRRSDWYHVEFTNALGRTRRRKAAKTRGLAEEILRKHEDDTTKERHGLPTQNAGEIPASDLRDRYLLYLEPRVDMYSAAHALPGTSVTCRTRGLTTPPDTRAILSIRATRSSGNWLSCVSMIDWPRC